MSCLQSYKIKAAPWVVDDEPRFAHREVLVDTCRHFQSGNLILKGQQLHHLDRVSLAPSSAGAQVDDRLDGLCQDQRHALAHCGFSILPLHQVRLLPLSMTHPFA